MRSLIEEAAKHLLDEQIIPELALAVEIKLARGNLLHAAEKANLVPIVVNPNPYHPITQSRAHERWWRDNPEAGVAYCNSITTRQRALCRLLLLEPPHPVVSELDR